MQAAWIYIGTDEGGSGEYYHPDIQRRGSTATLNSFTVLSVPDMAPIWDPKKPTRYKLVKFESEMSTYQFDCKAKTVQLTKRVFYSDGGGLFPIIEHRSTDKLLQEHNSEFAKQFRKTPISFKSKYVDSANTILEKLLVFFSDFRITTKCRQRCIGTKEKVIVNFSLT